MALKNNRQILEKTVFTAAVILLLILLFSTLSFVGVIDKAKEFMDNLFEKEQPTEQPNCIVDGIILVDYSHENSWYKETNTPDWETLNYWAKEKCSAGLTTEECSNINLEGIKLCAWAGEQLCIPFDESNVINIAPPEICMQFTEKNVINIIPPAPPEPKPPVPPGPGPSPGALPEQKISEIEKAQPEPIQALKQPEPKETKGKQTQISFAEKIAGFIEEKSAYFAMPKGFFENIEFNNPLLIVFIILAIILIGAYIKKEIDLKRYNLKQEFDDALERMYVLIKTKDNKLLKEMYDRLAYLYNRMPEQDKKRYAEDIIILHDKLGKIIRIEK